MKKRFFTENCFNELWQLLQSSSWNFLTGFDLFQIKNSGHGALEREFAYEARGPAFSPKGFSALLADTMEPKAIDR